MEVILIDSTRIIAAFYVTSSYQSTSVVGIGIVGVVDIFVSVVVVVFVFYRLTFVAAVSAIQMYLICQFFMLVFILSRIPFNWKFLSHSGDLDDVSWCPYCLRELIWHLST